MTDEKQEVVPATSLGHLAPIIPNAQVQIGSGMGLSIDHGTGKWVYAGVPIEGTLTMAFITYRQFRLLWNSSYTDAPDNGEIVCRSWNGSDAYGVGRRPKRGEDWRKLVAPQRCTDGDGNVCCPAGHGKDWQCRPQLQVFAMVCWPDSDAWQPAFWNSRRRQVTPTERAYQLALMRASKSLKTPDPRKPWEYGFAVPLFQSSGRVGYVPRFEGPAMLDDPDRSQITSWVEQNSKMFWAAECDKARDRMLETGQEEDDADE